MAELYSNRIHLSSGLPHFLHTKRETPKGLTNGMPKHIRPIMDAAMVGMAMTMGLTSAIVNPCDQRLMETIKSCDIIKNHNLYADSYLEI